MRTQRQKLAGMYESNSGKWLHRAVLIFSSQRDVKHRSFIASKGWTFGVSCLDSWGCLRLKDQVLLACLAIFSLQTAIHVHTSLSWPDWPWLSLFTWRSPTQCSQCFLGEAFPGFLGHLAPWCCTVRTETGQCWDLAWLVVQFCKFAGPLCSPICTGQRVALKGYSAYKQQLELKTHNREVSMRRALGEHCFPPFCFFPPFWMMWTWQLIGRFHSTRTMQSIWITILRCL